MQISIRIDNKKVRCAKGETILNVARGCGVSIPTLCSHEALLPYGACRLCIVEVAHRGIRRIVASCTTTVQDGMYIHTRSRRIIALRKTLVGLLASRCPDAPVVQRLAKDLGAAPMPPAPPADLCIRCGLCVRFCSEVVGTEALCFAGKGQNRKPAVAFFRNSQECIGCGSCAIICPTGAVRLHDEMNGEHPVRVMDTWETTLSVLRCRSDGVPVAPERLRAHVAARCQISEGFLERCLSCKTADTRILQR